MMLNTRDYPTTSLPGSVPLPSNHALLDTVRIDIIYLLVTNS